MTKMKKYRVSMYFEGELEFDIEAVSEEEAEDKAMEMFDDMDDREIVSNIADIDISIYDNLGGN